MAVRAKFYVVGNEPVQGGAEQHNVTLLAVTDGAPESENHQFWAATPAGRVELWTVNPAAWDQFAVGAEFYVDFTPADERRKR